MPDPLPTSHSTWRHSKILGNVRLFSPSAVPEWEVGSAAASSPRDPIAGYLSVLSAIANLTSLPVLGEVLNGMTADNEYDEVNHAYTDGDTPGLGMALWARSLGEQLANASHYTAFACGGVADVKGGGHGIPNDRGGHASLDTLHHLRVLRGNAVVASWPLNAPLPVDELLEFCSSAQFGNLHTQTTVFDPTVRTAMELPAVASSADGYSFEIIALSSGVKSFELPIQGPLSRSQDHGYNDHWHGYKRCLGYAKVSEPFRDIEVSPRLATSLVEDIKKGLMRDAAIAVPYKLNVYSPGGFFKPHVDTPTLSAAHMLGTAVLALPGSFTGGALRVCAAAGHLPVHTPGKPPKYEVTFDWSSGAAKAWAPKYASALPWAAFFGDCVHEVLPVTSGHRVTITFGIVASPGKGDNQIDAVDSDKDVAPGTEAGTPPAQVAVTTVGLGGEAAAAPPLVGPAAILARALAIVSARPDGAASFGILLSHKYTLGAAAVGQLKGADAALYAALNATGLYRLALQPVAYRYHSYEGRPGSYPRSTSSHTVHAFGAQELDSLRKQREGASGGGASSFSFGAGFSETAAAPRPHIPFVRFASTESHILPGATPGALLKHDSIEASEHTGNEARAGIDDYIYFSVALIVAPLQTAPAPVDAVAV